MNATEVCAGIDIGGTNCLLGLCNRQGTVLLTHELPTSNYPEAADFVGAAWEWLLAAANGLGATIVAAGIGSPNGNYYTGNMEHAPNMAWKGIVPLAELFRSVSGLKVVAITNDANAAALGELYFGGAKGLRNFVMITLGTGVGGGFMVNGELLYGADGLAGEFGHVTLVRNGRLCGCGRRGCLETYTSAGGILQTVRELLSADNRPSLLRQTEPKQLSCPLVFSAAQSGDRLALQAINDTALHLAEALSSLCALLSPSHIFIYGGLARAGDALLLPLQRFLQELLLPHQRGKIIMTTSLLLDNVAIAGAAALGWQALAEAKKSTDPSSHPELLVNQNN